MICLLYFLSSEVLYRIFSFLFFLLMSASYFSFARFSYFPELDQFLYNSRIFNPIEVSFLPKNISLLRLQTIHFNKHRRRLVRTVRMWRQTHHNLVWHTTQVWGISEETERRGFIPAGWETVVASDFPFSSKTEMKSLLRNAIYWRAFAMFPRNITSREDTSSVVIVVTIILLYLLRLTPLNYFKEARRYDITLLRKLTW
jgi:hypothetical protein